jgi:DNA processing protein
MDDINILKDNEIPFLLQQISEPPKRLFVKGKLPKEDSKVLCVVGSRRHSNYGEESCKKLISGLSGYNICIVSGMAHGIDSIAHRAALDANLQTIAFPGSGLDPSVLYPQKYRELALEIVYSGGGLVSEFEMTQPPLPWTFPMRNRLMAGISHATLVIEAKEKSGTLITSRLAMEYNRDVGAVPGQIYSKLSKGPNDLISNGAKIIRDSNDILEMLGFAIKEEQGTIDFSDPRIQNLNDTERKIINILQRGPISKDILIYELGLETREFNVLVSSMEMDGFIKETEGLIKIA